MNHATIDQRSLAFGRLIAEKLRHNPDLLQTAKNNIDRWLQTCSANTAPALLEWQPVLESLDRAIEVLTSIDEDSVRMRQSNPFAGVLTAIERNEVIRRFYPHDAPAT